MPAPVTIPTPVIQGFEVFKPGDSTPSVWPIRWRYLSHDGLTPVEVWVETTATDEMTTQSDLMDDADAAAVVAYTALNYTY